MVLLEPRYKSKNISVTIQCHPCSLKIKLPKDRLIQVLFNVIRNAVDASPHGGKIDINITKKSSRLTFSIIDEGEGISDEFAAQIYEPFFTTKHDSNAKGLGLGLPVTKSMVESMSGAIRFKNNRKKGTTFTIEIPLNESMKEVKYDG
jgi:signal transduction histidine kinase